MKFQETFIIQQAARVEYFAYLINIVVRFHDFEPLRLIIPRWRLTVRGAATYSNNTADSSVDARPEAYSRAKENPIV